MSVWPEERDGQALASRRAFNTVDMTINIGPQHPATHGVFRMVLTVDGEVVVDCEPYIGYIHRGAREALRERGLPPGHRLRDRTDYLARFNAASSATAGRREARRARSAGARRVHPRHLAELNRINSPLHVPRRLRRRCRLLRHELHLRLPRTRAHLQLLRRGRRRPHVPHYFRPGGVAEDLPAQLRRPRALVCIGSIKRGSKTSMACSPATRSSSDAARTLAHDHRSARSTAGITGPILRATGLPLDMRKAEPYSIYDRLDFDIPVGQAGRHASTATSSASPRSTQSCASSSRPRTDARRPRSSTRTLPKTLRIDNAECYVRTEGTRASTASTMARGGDKALPHEDALARASATSPRSRRWTSATTSPMPSSSSARSTSCSVRSTSDADIRLRSPGRFDALRGIFGNWTGRDRPHPRRRARDDDRRRLPHLRRAQGDCPIPAAPRAHAHRSRRTSAGLRRCPQARHQRGRAAHQRRPLGIRVRPLPDVHPRVHGARGAALRRDWGVRNLALGLFYRVRHPRAEHRRHPDGRPRQRQQVRAPRRRARGRPDDQLRDPARAQPSRRGDGRRHARPQQIAAMQSITPTQASTGRSSCSSRSPSASSSPPCSAELHRAPFDIPVAESEIVGGYFVEYSGIRWSMFQLTEYASMWAFSVFGSVVFLGGWNSPRYAATGSAPTWVCQLLITFIKSFALDHRHHLGPRDRPAPAHRPAHELLLEGAAPARLSSRSS